MTKGDYKGHLAILLACVIFGVNIPVTKSLIADWVTPAGYTLIRMLFGAVVFWTIGLFFPKEKVGRKDLLTMAVGSFFGFIASQFCFAYSLKFTSPVICALMLSLIPILVLLLSVLFLKDAINRKKITGVLLSVAGASLIISQSADNGAGSDNLLGVFLALSSALGYGIYLIIAREVSLKYNPVTVIKHMFLFAAVMLLPFAYSELGTQRIFSAETTTSALSQLAFALLFSTTLSYFLMSFALARLQATTISTYMNLQPITASVIAILVGQDILTWDKPIAAALVLSGVYGVTKK